MVRVVAVTPDLFFSTRIQSALERAGYAVRVVEERETEAVMEEVAEMEPALLILDIGAAGGWPWQALLEAIRSAQPALPVLAYGSHMDVEATRTAQALGATRVVAKSEFVNNLLNLVERYAARSGA